MPSPSSRTTLYSLVDAVSIDIVSITDTIGVMMVLGAKSGVTKVEAFGEKTKVWLGGWGMFLWSGGG
jgi:hypothetical protein